MAQPSWVPPFQIDSSSTSSHSGPLVAVSNAGRIVVAMREASGSPFQQGRIVVYCSTDNGTAFEKTTIPPPLVPEFLIDGPDALSIDGDGNIYVMWHWFDVLPSFLVISKSTDGGVTFSTFWSRENTTSQIRQRRMSITNDNTVNVLWDSTHNTNETNVVFYSRFPNGSPIGRNDHVVPSPGDAMSIREANFHVTGDTIQYVCMAAPILTFDNYRVYYSRSTDSGDSFPPLVAVDSTDWEFPAIAKTNYGSSYVLFSNGEPRTHSLLYASQVSDSGGELLPRFRVGSFWMVTAPEPVFVSGKQGNYLTYEGTDSTAVRAAFYEYSKLDEEPSDSAFFSFMRDPHLAVDTADGKYLVATHQTEFRVYFTKKDVIASADPEDTSPKDFRLNQNYPNPFNPSTTFSFSIPQSSFITLTVFDLLGREVATIVSEKLGPGRYERSWDAGMMSSGLYFYRLQGEGFTDTKKFILLR